MDTSGIGPAPHATHESPLPIITQMEEPIRTI